MHITRLATQAMCRASRHVENPAAARTFSTVRRLCAPPGGNSYREGFARLPRSATSELVLLPGRERSPRALIVLGVSGRLGRGQDLNGDPITAEKGGERPD